MFFFFSSDCISTGGVNFVFLLLDVIVYWLLVGAVQGCSPAEAVLMVAKTKLCFEFYQFTFAPPMTKDSKMMQKGSVKGSANCHVILLIRYISIF